MFKLENPIAGYFIWRGSPEIFSFGGFTLWWSAVLFVLAFLISRQILLFLYKKEHKPLSAVSCLCIYLVLAALAGARLGYLIFYEPGAIFSKAQTIIFPFEFEPDFHLLDTGEFSVHGAALGILLFLWIYSRKNPFQQKYFQLLDRVAIASVLCGVFLLLASFVRPEIKGKPTASVAGAISISPVLRGLMKVPCCVMRSPGGKNPLERVEVRKDPAPPKDENIQKSLILYLFFKAGASERLVNEFLIGDVKIFLYEMSLHVHEPGDQPLQYRIFLQKDGSYIARIQTKGISRYPVRIFEAASCLFIFILLWWHRSEMKHAGRLFGLFMILFWSQNSAYGFLMETHHPVQIALNIGFVLMGVIALVLSYRQFHAVVSHANGVSEKLTRR